MPVDLPALHDEADRLGDGDDLERVARNGDDGHRATSVLGGARVRELRSSQNATIPPVREAPVLLAGRLGDHG